MVGCCGPYLTIYFHLCPFTRVVSLLLQSLATALRLRTVFASLPPSLLLLPPCHCDQAHIATILHSKRRAAWGNDKRAPWEGKLQKQSWHYGVWMYWGQSICHIIFCVRINFVMALNWWSFLGRLWVNYSPLWNILFNDNVKLGFKNIWTKLGTALLKQNFVVSYECFRRLLKWIGVLVRW